VESFEFVGHDSLTVLNSWLFESELSFEEVVVTRSEMSL